jgi:HEAT repeat protein
MFNTLDNPVKVRKKAGETLGQMKAGEAVPDLIDALNDGWFRISETARAALVAIGAPAIPALIERYTREAEGDRGADGVVYRSLLIFGEVGTVEAKRVLVKALKLRKGKRALSIRHHAAIGLGLSADPRVVEPLILAFEKEKDFRVAKYISRSLTWLTDQEVSATRRDAWRIWWELEGRRKFKKRQTVDQLLDDVAGGAVRLPKGKDGLAELESSEGRIARLAKELGAEDPKVRRAAWRDLEGMDEKALPVLRETLKSGNRRARANAKAIIARITAVPE